MSKLSFGVFAVTFAISALFIETALDGSASLLETSLLLIEESIPKIESLNCPEPTPPEFELASVAYSSSTMFLF